MGRASRASVTLPALLSWLLAMRATSVCAQAGLERSSVQPPQGLLQILFAGGPLGVAIMLGLLALSLTAAYLVFEHFLTIRRETLLPAGLQSDLRDSLARGQWAEAEQACLKQPSLMAFVVLQGLAERDADWPAAEKAMEEALSEQAARLMRKIEYLSVIGNLAPMLGLLGTVSGMILAFREVASSAGIAGAGELAEGIYQALVTTVVGLIIAIPSLGAFAILRNRVDQLVAESTYLIQHLTRPMKRCLNSPTPPSSKTMRQT